MAEESENQRQQRSHDGHRAEVIDSADEQGEGDADDDDGEHGAERLDLRPEYADDVTQEIDDRDDHREYADCDEFAARRRCLYRSLGRFPIGVVFRWHCAP